MTDLDVWLALSGTSEARFAAMTGVSRRAVQCWRQQVRIPSESNMVAIENAIDIRNAELLVAVALGHNAFLPTQ